MYIIKFLSNFTLLLLRSLFHPRFYFKSKKNSTPIRNTIFINFFFCIYIYLFKKKSFPFLLKIGKWHTNINLLLSHCNLKKLDKFIHIHGPLHVPICNTMDTSFMKPYYANTYPMHFQNLQHVLMLFIYWSCCVFAT